MTMILPLLLTFAVPAAEEYPEPPSPCAVSWADGISQRFVGGTEQRITRRCRELVEALEYDAEPGSIHVDVGGDTYAFTVRVELLVDGKVASTQENDEEVCECSANDLSAFAMKRVAAAIEAHRKAAVEPPAIEVEAEADPVPGPKNSPAEASKDTHGLRWAGVGVGAVGAATLIAGAVMRPMEETRRVREGEAWNTETGPRFEPRTTAAMIGIGAAAVGVGVALIVADGIVSKKRKRERSAFVTPCATPTSFSIALRARF